MQEFIVWYKNKDTGRVFSREFNLNQLILQNHLDEICDSPGCVDYEILSILPSVEKVDIGDNTIYADSSLIKVHDKKSKFYDDICKVSYDKRICAYKLTSIDFEDETSEFIKADYLNRYYKIVDTIQENKLGLINE